MMFTVNLFGREVLHITTDKPDTDTSPGDATSYPIGFTPQPGDQRWQPSLEP